MPGSTGGYLLNLKRFFRRLGKRLVALPLVAVSPAAISQVTTMFPQSAEMSDYQRFGQPEFEQPFSSITAQTNVKRDLQGGVYIGTTSLPTANAGLDDLPLLQTATKPSAFLYGPQELDNLSEASQRTGYRSLGSQVGAVKWEMAAVAAYYTAINGKKLFHDATAPHFHKEGWFGKSTADVGVDKLAHAYSTYVISELIHARLRRKTQNARGIQFTAAALASVAMLYTEFWDSIERSAGWSWQDVTFNALGAGFSILRNSVPNLDQKLDYRMMIVPNSKIFEAEGKGHFEQQRFFLALKPSGFEAFKEGPLRFLELHVGYYGKDFTLSDRAAGVRPKRRIFVGVGINLRELLFKNSRKSVGRAAGEVLDYFQPPYTAVRAHVTN